MKGQIPLLLATTMHDMVEKNLEYWLGTVKRFCPWQAYVLVERKE